MRMYTSEADYTDEADQITRCGTLSHSFLPLVLAFLLLSEDRSQILRDASKALLNTYRCITVTYWARWRLKSPVSRLLAEPFVQAQIKENTKAPCHWPLEGNPHVTGVYPHKGPITRKMFPFDNIIVINKMSTDSQCNNVYPGNCEKF